MEQSEPTNLIQVGDFTLNSGAKSKWKLVADKFIEDNLPGLVELVMQLVGPFSSVEGIPRGGVLLANALNDHRTAMMSMMGGNDLPHLIIDDVLTTGGSMERVRSAYWESRRVPGWNRDKQWLLANRVVGVVVFARGQCPQWIKAIYQMPEAFWLKPKHG